MTEEIDLPQLCAEVVSVKQNHFYDASLIRLTQGTAHGTNSRNFSPNKIGSGLKLWFLFLVVLGLLVLL